MYLKKNNKGDEKTSIKHIAGKMFFISPEINLFFYEEFSYLPKLTVFSKIGNNPMRELGKKNIFLVMRGLNLMSALI